MSLDRKIHLGVVLHIQSPFHPICVVIDMVFVWSEHLIQPLEVFYYQPMYTVDIIL